MNQDNTGAANLLPYLEGLSPEAQKKLQAAFGQVLAAKDSDLQPVQVREIEPVRSWLKSRYYNSMSRNLFEFWEAEIADFIEGGYNEWVLSGAIGTGKSTAALITAQRKLYELSCFEHPQRLFRLADMTQIFFAYLSVNLKQAELTGFGQFREMIDQTQYFQEEYPRDPKITSVLRFPGEVSFIPGSDQISFIGTNLYGCLLDEVNFLRVGGGGAIGDVQKAQNIYQEATDRRRSRFMYKGRDPGFSLLISSSTVQTSFTASRIRAASKGKPGQIKVTNAKLWEVKKGAYSEKVFYVFNGSDKEDAFVIENHRDVVDLLEDPVEEKRLDQAATSWLKAHPQHAARYPVAPSAPKSPTFSEHTSTSPADPPESPDGATPSQGSSVAPTHEELLKQKLLKKGIPGAVLPLVEPVDPDILAHQRRMGMGGRSQGLQIVMGGDGRVQKPRGNVHAPATPFERFGLRTYVPEKFGRGVPPPVALSPSPAPVAAAAAKVPDPTPVDPPAPDPVIPDPVGNLGFVHQKWVRPQTMVPGPLVASQVTDREGDVTKRDVGRPDVTKSVILSSLVQRYDTWVYQRFTPEVAVSSSGHDGSSKPASADSSQSTSLEELVPSRTFSSRDERHFDVREGGHAVTHQSGNKDLTLEEVMKLGDVEHPEDENPLMDFLWDHLPQNLQNCISRVPIDFRASFEGDLYTALKNIAGVSIAPVGKLFTSRALWARAMDPEIKSPFKRESFPLTMKGSDSIVSLFRADAFFSQGAPLRHPGAARHIRVDQSKNHDSTGIACVHRAGWLETTGIREPIVELDFAIRIEPPAKPDRIGFHKIRSFLAALRDMGMLIARVTFDQYQSEDHMQLLELAHFKTAYLSVDKTDKPYVSVVNLLNEGRLKMYPYEPLRLEFFSLDHDRAAGKVDHPNINSDGSRGSKDVADAVVGAVFDCVSGEEMKQEDRVAMAQEVRVVAPNMTSRRYGGGADFDWLLPKEYQGKVDIEVEERETGFPHAHEDEIEDE